MATCARPRSQDSFDTDDLELFRRWRGSQDRAVFSELVSRHLGLAHAMARRYGGRGLDGDDLSQVAMVGLCKSVERFDPERGVAFSTFAVPTILGELRRHFRDRGWVVRVPRRLQELRRHAEQELRRLEQEGDGRRPSIEEVAAALGADPDDVAVATNLGGCYQPSSLDAMRRPDLLDEAESPADVACRDVTVARLLDMLADRERRIFVLRYFHGMTQQEIADRVGISQMHVSRLLRAGLEDLRGAAA